MGTEERLTFSLPVGRVTRGHVIKVRLSGDTAQYRSVRLELLQVERKLKSKLEAKANHALVVNHVAVPDGSVQVELTVPGSLPNAYTGTMIGWDYEVRLIGDRAGRRDDEQVEAIDLQGTEPTSGSNISLLSLRSSYPARVAGLEAAEGRQHGAPVGFAVLGAIALLIGLLSGATDWLVIAGIWVLVAAFGVVSMNRKRHHSLEDVQFQCPTKAIRLGQPVVVQVGNALGQSLEVGLVALEISAESGGKQVVAVRHVAYEQWAPVIGPTLTFPTTATMPSGFVGEYNALHWMVILRRADATPSIRDLTARAVSVAITH